MSCNHVDVVFVKKEDTRTVLSFNKTLTSTYTPLWTWGFFPNYFLGSFPYCGDDGSWLCVNQWNLSLFHGVFRRKKVLLSEFWLIHCFDYCTTLAVNVHQCLYYAGNIYRLCYTMCLIQFSQMLFPVHVYCMH